MHNRNSSNKKDRTGLKFLQNQILAVTMGDPCGIGPEIIAKLILEAAPSDLTDYVFIGPRRAFDEAYERLLNDHQKSMHRGVGCDANSHNFKRQKSPHPKDSGNLANINWIDIPEQGPFTSGKISAAGGRAAIQAIEIAHQLCTQPNGCMGMVTGPIGKEAIRMAGSPFSGHTDMLKSLASVPFTRMAMVYGRLKVVMTTLHVAWRDVPALLSEQSVYDTILAAHNAFATWRRPFPVIAVAGLNPHAGEHGMFGDEEERAIIPAIERARQVNPNISGPWPADSMFKPDFRRKTDIFIAQSHDQGLIAIKALGGIKCVNVTLGLPYVRTSVGHGTAYDIAGKGCADHRGLLAALKLARQLVAARSRPYNSTCQTTQNRPTVTSFETTE